MARQLDGLVLTVAPDPAWYPLSLEGDLDAWLEGARSQLWRLRGVDDPDAEMLALAEGVLRDATEIARVEAQQMAEQTQGQVAVLAAMLLVPESVAETAAAATFRMMRSPDRDVDFWRQNLTLSPAQREGDVVDDVVDTPSGPCLRLQQRVLAAEGDGTSVADLVTLVWTLPGYDGVIAGSVWFPDLARSEQHRWRALQLAELVGITPPAGG